MRGQKRQQQQGGEARQSRGSGGVTKSNAKLLPYVSSNAIFRLFEAYRFVVSLATVVGWCAELRFYYC